MAPLPTARYYLAGAATNGRVYAVGGTNAAGTPLATVAEYNPLTDRWEEQLPLASARYGLGAVVADNGRLYAVGGADSTYGTSPVNYLAVAEEATLTPAAMQYHLADGLGSTLALADAMGVPTASYRYDVFGALRQVAGPSSTDYRFTGEQHDPTLNLVYLRARVYDPSVGRFLSRDAIVPDPTNSQDFNRYAYVRNRPSGAIDPSGLLTYFIGGVGGSGSTEYEAFVEEMGRMGIRKPVGPFGAYDFSSRRIRAALGPLLGKGVADLAAIALNMVEVGVRAALPVTDLDAAELAAQMQWRRKSLAEGEQLNIVAYSGGSTTAFNALKILRELDPQFSIDNLVLIGGAAPTWRPPCNVTKTTTLTGRKDIIGFLHAIRMDAAGGARMDEDWTHFDYFKNEANRAALIQYLKEVVGLE